MKGNGWLAQCQCEAWDLKKCIVAESVHEAEVAQCYVKRWAAEERSVIASVVCWRVRRVA